MRVAVDAWNLVDDRRGMGRYVRRVLTDWQSERDLEVTLLVRKAGHAALLTREFPYHVRTDILGSYDTVWYPWNAMRFTLRGARRVALFHDAFAFTYAHANWVARYREQAPIRRALARADDRSANSALGPVLQRRLEHRQRQRAGFADRLRKARGQTLSRARFHLATVRS